MEGAVDDFCCGGCEMAAAIIRGAGLERYYATREAPAPRPSLRTTDDWSAVPVHVTEGGPSEARLVIDGLRCASCVWVTEHVLERTPGVERATVSYATGRTTLRWDPAVVDLPSLARRIAALGYRPRPLDVGRTPDRDLMRRMGVAVVAALAIMGLYEGLYAGWWYGAIDPGYAALFRWTSLLLATPVTIWCAAPFFTGAWRGLRHGILHMDLPVALGVAILYVHGLAQTLRQADSYLDSLSMLVALLLVGRVLESHGRRQATDAAAALVGTVPRTARRLRDDRLETVAVDQLEPGDRIDAGAGEELAADGRVVEGTGQVRMALVTGESAPVLVHPGDRVVAGTLLVDGAITIAVEATGADTVVHRMAAELLAAQDRGGAPDAADRIAPWFTIGTLVIALGTLAGWWMAGGLEVALSRTVAVLVVACPCALALARPLAAAAGLGAAARRGLLLRSSEQLLALAHVTEAGLDKTGTVTLGAMTVTEADDATLRVAAGLERYSRHPIAQAVTREASRRGIPLPAAGDILESPGEGIEGTVDGARWCLRAAGPGAIALSRAAQSAAAPARIIRFGDVIRPDVAHALRALRALGVTPVLLTGDHAEVAAQIGSAAGIVDIRAAQTPTEKAAWIRARRAAGQRVLFAGDGLNDGPALAAADVGLAMSEAAASSILIADGIIASESLAPIVAGIRAARAGGAHDPAQPVAVGGLQHRLGRQPRWWAGSIRWSRRC